MLLTCSSSYIQYIQLQCIAMQCILFSPLYQVLFTSWIASKAHLEISAGELAPHEASDCLCVTGGLGQVHLHSEPTAEPAQKRFYEQSTVVLHV